MRPRALRVVLSLAFVSLIESFNVYVESRVFRRTSVLRSAQEAPSSPIEYCVHLYSLKWSSLDDSASFSKTVRDTWRWKNEVLGDGRDFFVPRPKTLTNLQEFILQKAAETEGNESYNWLYECVVLSNCARFEVILLTRENARPLDFLAGCFVTQMESFQKLSFKTLQISFDRPGNIDCLAKIEKADRQRVSELAEGRHWKHVEGAENVCRHLCMIAAGMSDRPSRPGRPVPFQPFSSRDAHVLLQLKRTLENARSASRIALLLRYALIAGKAVRNPEKIRELQELRQYGTGNTKYDSTPPPHVLERVTQIAIQKGIDPTVEECVNAWKSLNTGKDVSSFRNDALNLALNKKEKKWVLKRLHEPTIQLRNGGAIDTDSFLKDLKSDLVTLFR